MKERPILFSAPMVRAILENRKTQTRRVVKPQPTIDGGADFEPGSGCCDWWFNWKFDDGVDPCDMPKYCPYGQPGDRLWVREHIKIKEDGGFQWLTYAADDSWVVDPAGIRRDAKRTGNRSRPSIHMPRWASRITLEITDVYVERLQEISEEDAKAEGVLRAGLTYRENFHELWSTIHAADGPNGWNANPWVWVIEFKRVAHTTHGKERG